MRERHFWKKIQDLVFTSQWRHGKWSCSDVMLYWNSIPEATYTCYDVIHLTSPESDIKVKRKNRWFFRGMRERHFWKKIPNSIWGVSKRHFWKKIHSTYFRPKIVNLKNIRFPGSEPASFLEKKSNHFFSFIRCFWMLTSYK